MKLLFTVVALAIGGTVAYAVWAKEEKKKAPPLTPAPNVKPCSYSRLAVAAWDNAQQSNYVIFDALDRDAPPPWNEQVAAGWPEKMIQATLSGYQVLLITVPKGGLNPRFWVANVPIGPSGPSWVEYPALAASYCKSLGDQA
jgi:hypothetical protein